MSRLPTVSGDGNAWGTILNDFLSVSHKSDGTLKNLYVNLGDFCAIDGSTDDSTGFTTAYTLASTSGRALWHPGGTLLKGNDTLLPNVPVVGAGPGVSIIKLKNGANADLFSANTGNINLAGASTTGSNTGTNFWSFKGITLDGNKANQSSGISYPIRAYGYGHILEHVEVVSGYSGGILLDWNGNANPTPPATDLMPRWYDVKVHDCNGIGIQVAGPTDMQWIAVNGYDSGSHNLHIAPNCIALRMAHSHFWSTPVGVNAVTALVEATGTVMTACQIEGSDACALVLLANDMQINDALIGNSPAGLRNGRGIQLGQAAGQTPYPGQILQSAGVTLAAPSNVNTISGKLVNCEGGAIDEKNTSANLYNLNIYQTAGLAVVGGYIGSSSSGFIQVNGLALDYSPGTGGTFQLHTRSANGFIASGEAGDYLFAINTRDKAHGGGFQVVNGYPFTGFSDGGSTQKYSFDSSTGNLTSQGNLSVGQSATTPDPGAGGTITTAGIGLARVTPAASRTGVILQAGTQPGQKCTVVNNSASFTITFATAATSNVAQGASLVIAALGKYDFIWDSVAARWY